MSPPATRRLDAPLVLAGLALVITLTGLAAQRLSGAPATALVIQAVGLALGGAAALGLARWAGPPGPRLATVVLGLAFTLSLLSLADPGMEGVHRWVDLGPLTLQPAPLILPFVAWVLAARPANWTVGSLIAALGAILAAQPDASTTGALAVVVAATMLGRRRVSPPEVMALLVAAAGFAWAVARPDPLVPVDHVEQVLATTFAANAPMGCLAGLALCLVPASFLLAARTTVAPRRTLAFALCGLWTVLVVANLVGNYPAPVVGHGASFAAGWLASLGLVAWGRDRLSH